MNPASLPGIPGCAARDREPRCVALEDVKELDVKFASCFDGGSELAAVQRRCRANRVGFVKKDGVRFDATPLLLLRELVSIAFNLVRNELSRRFLLAVVSNN